MFRVRHFMVNLLMIFIFTLDIVTSIPLHTKHTLKTYSLANTNLLRNSSPKRDIQLTTVSTLHFFNSKRNIRGGGDPRKFPSTPQPPAKVRTRRAPIEPCFLRMCCVPFYATAHSSFPLPDFWYISWSPLHWLYTLSIKTIWVAYRET